MKKNQGIGLIEVLVGVGLLAIFSFVIVQALKMQAQQQKIIDVKVSMLNIHARAQQAARKYQLSASFDAVMNRPVTRDCFKGKGTNCPTTASPGIFVGFRTVSNTPPPAGSFDEKMNQTMNGGYTLDGRTCNTNCPVSAVTDWTWDCPSVSTCKGVKFSTVVTVDPSVSASAEEMQIISSLPAVTSENIYQRTKEVGLLRNLASTCSVPDSVNLGAAQMGCPQVGPGSENKLFDSDLGKEFQNGVISLAGGTSGGITGDPPLDPECPSPQPTSCAAGSLLVTDTAGCKRCNPVSCPAAPAICSASDNKSFIRDVGGCLDCKCNPAPSTCPVNAILVTNAALCKTCQCAPGMVATADPTGGLICEPVVYDTCNRVIPGGGDGWSAFGACQLNGFKSRTCLYAKNRYCTSTCNNVGDIETTPCCPGCTWAASLSACSVTCGGGTQNKNYTCKLAGALHNDSHCVAAGQGAKPASTTPTCNTQGCPFSATYTKAVAHNDGGMYEFQSEKPFCLGTLGSATVSFVKTNWTSGCRIDVLANYALNKRDYTLSSSWDGWFSRGSCAWRIKSPTKPGKSAGEGTGFDCKAKVTCTATCTP